MHRWAAGAGDLADFLDAALAGGVDVVQLREKGLEARDELGLLEVFAAAAQRHGKLWAVNDRADVALASGAPSAAPGPGRPAGAGGPADPRRRLVIGRSTHSPAQFDAGLSEAGVDYVCAGPTWETPTKPGRPAAGPALLTHAASAPSPRPWFAIGGISLDRLDEVIATARGRVVVVRAITDAEDPGAAARAFTTRLAAAA